MGSQGSEKLMTFPRLEGKAGGTGIDSILPEAKVCHILSIMTHLLPYEGNEVTVIEQRLKDKKDWNDFSPLHARFLMF